MQQLPHHYFVAASADTDSGATLCAPGVPSLASATPAEFGGPGDRWSPESLLVAALADCFVLTFRGIAKNSRLSWTTVRCEATGVLDRVDRFTQFTAFELRAELTISSGTDPALAQRLLEKAEESCLIGNSLKAAITLETEIAVGHDTAAVAAP